jgi:hypothetical protein
MALAHTRDNVETHDNLADTGQIKRLQTVAKRKGLKAVQLIRLYVDAGLNKEK